MRVKFNRFKAPKPDQAVCDKYLVFYHGLKLFQDSDTLPECSSLGLFGNDAPLIVDLGCGQAEFLLDSAKRNPNLNYVGIDRHWKSLYFAIAQANSMKLENVKFIRQDLRFGLKKIPSESIEEVYLLFPPPPTKTGLVKKEFVNAELIKEIGRILKKDGRLVFGSDKHEYFIDKISLINKNEVLKYTNNDLHNINTRFHDFWQRLGVNSEFVEYIKV